MKKKNSKTRKSQKVKKPKIKEEINFKHDILDNLRRYDPGVKITKHSMQVLESMLISRMTETLKLANSLRQTEGKRKFINPRDLESALKLQSRGKITSIMVEEGWELVEKSGGKRKSKSVVESRIEEKIEDSD